MTDISSPQNPLVKLAASLRSARQRKRSGKTLIDGFREIEYAARGNVQLEQILVDECCIDEMRQQCPAIFGAISRNAIVTGDLPVNPVSEVPVSESSVQILRTTEAIMRRISFGDRSSKAVAIASRPTTNLDALDFPISDDFGTHPSSKSSMSLFLVLDQVEKPGNVGAVLRTADAMGASAVLLSDPQCDPYSPNAIRASQSAVFTIPVATGSAREVADWLAPRTQQVLAARVEAKKPYTAVDYRLASAVLLGSEADGLDRRWRPKDFPDLNLVDVTIAMRGQLDSLNVSTTAAIIAYEATRQRDSGQIDATK
jgi:TrmH family RNA methyltransferase